MLNTLLSLTFNEAEQIVLLSTVDSREIFRISYDLSCHWQCLVVIPMLRPIPDIIYQTYDHALLSSPFLRV